MSERPRRSSRRPIPRKPADAAKPKAKPAKQPARAVPVAKKPAAAPKGRVARTGGSDSSTATLKRRKTTVVGDPHIGKTIGRCRVEERIGLGKTAAVYRAHYEALDEKVAIKILTPQAGEMPELVERFHSEAKVIARLDNQNVVKIYDVGRQDDVHYMVMELLDGFSVLDLIEREGQVEVMDALRVIRQAAGGLAAAHAKGIIHRDVKPQNLLLLEDGTVKVLDFGLAGGFGDKSERVGTPHYMAPEVCRDGTADLGTDIYALGIVLWHLLAGQPPYAGLDIKAMLRKHIEGTPLHIERKVPRVPKEIAELIRELTRSDPLLRPTASSVVETLDRIGGEEIKERSGLRRRSTGRRARAIARKKSALGPALIGLVLVVGLIVVLGMGGDDDPKDTPKTTPPATDTAGGAEAPRTHTDLSGIESDTARVARERLEQERLARQAQLKADREALAKSVQALNRAVTFARERWHGKTDTQAVIDKYQRVYSLFKRTASGKEALRLLRGIKDGSLHPHPDRKWTDADVVEKAREDWKTVHPVIQKQIDRHDYAGAYAKLPDRVNAADGGLTSTLRFWDRILSDLKRFKRGLIKYAAALPKDERMLETPAGLGQVRVVKASEIQVLIKGTRKTFAWHEIEPAALYGLGRAAFHEQGYGYLLQLQSFAFAHKLEDSFWDVQLDLTSSPDARTHSEWLADIEKRLPAQLK